VTRQPAIVISIRDVEFNGVQAHSNGEVDPPPHVTSGITPLVRPPFARHGTPIGSVAAGKMLHEQACVDGNDDTRTEPRQETKDFAGLVVVVEARFLGKRSCTALPDCGDDARGSVHDEYAVGKGDDDGRRDGHDGSNHEIKPSVSYCRERPHGMQQGCIGRHDDRWQWRKRRIRGCVCCSNCARRGLVVGEDLVDAERHIGELVLSAECNLADWESVPRETTPRGCPLH